VQHTMRITGPESLGHLIQQARVTAGKTQAELAHELGISQRAITEIETGKATIQVRRLFALLKITGTSLNGQWNDDDA